MNERDIKTLRKMGADIITKRTKKPPKNINEWAKLIWDDVPMGKRIILPRSMRSFDEMI